MTKITVKERWEFPIDLNNLRGVISVDLSTTDGMKISFSESMPNDCKPYCKSAEVKFPYGNKNQFTIAGHDFQFCEKYIYISSNNAHVAGTREAFIVNGEYINYPIFKEEVNA